MPGESPVIVLLVPVPVKVVPPGIVVKLQDSVDGKPFNMTLPVETAQPGCTIVPIIADIGLAFTIMLTTFVVTLLPVQLLIRQRY